MPHPEHKQFRPRRRSRLKQAIAAFWCLGLALLSLPILGSFSGIGQTAPPPPPTPSPALEQTLAKLPPLAVHPLPPALAQWQDPDRKGDYFDQVQPAIVGALIWSDFPLKLYVAPLTPQEQAIPFRQQQAQTWLTAVQRAIQEWQAYFPLELVEQASQADIQIGRSPLPIRLDKTSNTRPTRGFALPRARSAETRFEFYAQPQPNGRSQLRHRMKIAIRPDQAIDYLQAAARHELGHAFGIWGHSPQPTDALYFSQVRQPAAISARDLNTLKKIYQQPTRLGWELPPASP